MDFGIGRAGKSVLESSDSSQCLGQAFDGQWRENREITRIRGKSQT